VRTTSAANASAPGRTSRRRTLAPAGHGCSAAPAVACAPPIPTTTTTPPTSAPAAAMGGSGPRPPRPASRTNEAAACTAKAEQLHHKYGL
jgi:hypothetical protein